MSVPGDNFKKRKGIDNNVRYDPKHLGSASNDLNTSLGSNELTRSLDYVIPAPRATFRVVLL